jgi:hypothetical protein
MKWLYENSEIELDDIPNGVVGFVYKITHIPSGKYYIGKKSIESNRTVKIGKRELEKLKEERKTNKVRGSLPKKKIVKKISDWETYFSSNEWIREQVSNGNTHEFKREILQFCKSKKGLSYYEVEWMFKYDVLRDEKSLNGNISGKFFRKDLEY